MHLVETHSKQDKGKSKGALRAETSKIADNPKAFEELFRQHYKDLCRYSLRFVKLEEVAEELVQDVFIKIWQNKGQLEVQSSMKAYMYTAVRNSSINYLKSQFARQDFNDHDSSKGQLHTNNTQEALDYQELTLLVAEAVERLPLQCRTIFELSRSRGFTHEEIAKEMQISPKTVENQIGIALKKLKKHLHTYWDVLLMLLIMLSKNNGYF